MISEQAIITDLIGAALIRLGLFSMPLIMAILIVYFIGGVVGWVIALGLTVLGVVLIAAARADWRDEVVWYEYDDGVLRCRTRDGRGVMSVPAAGIRRVIAVQSPRLGPQYVEVEMEGGRQLVFWYYLFPRVAELHQALGKSG